MRIVLALNKGIIRKEEKVKINAYLERQMEADRCWVIVTHPYNLSAPFLFQPAISTVN